MKIVVATDSFKGTLTAEQACGIIVEAIRRKASAAEVVTVPMADGGEGTAAAVIRAGRGRWVRRRVMGPLEDMRVDAGFAWFEQDATAVVEMAAASGMTLLNRRQLNPLRTTTYGTGELIKAAVKYGAKKVLLAVGGSATVDGGVGAATALGWKFLDEQDRDVPLGGAGLTSIKKIIKPANFKMPPVEILCDVDNPLCGSSGAARVYGPQKGATRAMVKQLEAGLSHLARVVRTQLGPMIKDIAGGGAAGGLAAGAVAFMNGRIVSGIETVMAHCNLASEVKEANWVITGEGSFDTQSLRGKVVSGVIRTAGRYNVPVAVIAGQVKLAKKQWSKLGIVDVFACRKDDVSAEYAMRNSKRLLRKAAEDFAINHLIERSVIAPVSQED